MARTHHANRFATTLTSTMGPTDLTASVFTTAGAPASPCYLVIDYDVPAKAEIVEFDGTFTGTSFVTTSLTNRYLSGSAATSGITHDSGASVISAPLGTSLEDIWDAIEGHTDATATHGMVLVASNATGVFTSLPAGFSRWHIDVWGQSQGTDDRQLYLQFNGDTGPNYHWSIHSRWADGTIHNTSTGEADVRLGIGRLTAFYLTHAAIDIFVGPGRVNAHSTFGHVTGNIASNMFTGQAVGSWAGASLTAIRLLPFTDPWNASNTFVSLYGLR